MNTMVETVNPNQALWEKGDFTRIAETMRKSGAELVAALGLQPGMQVLDLGCGDGTTAVPAAKSGADVLGVDIARNLVAAGNERITAEKISGCRIVTGDATQLDGVPDHFADLTLSIFGVMFAPRPFEVASEMVRVTRPGGRIVMGNWIPGDPTLVAQILRISAAYLPPPPPGFISPMLWGQEAEVLARFGAAGVSADQISFAKKTFTFSATYSPKRLVEQFKYFYGPTMNAFEAAEKNGKATLLQNELEELFNKQNKSTDPNTTEIPATYLLVQVRL